LSPFQIEGMLEEKFLEVTAQNCLNKLVTSYFL